MDDDTPESVSPQGLLPTTETYDGWLRPAGPHGSFRPGNTRPVSYATTTA
jgi:hypothetical protein